MEEEEEKAKRSRRRASLPVPMLPPVTAYPFPSCLFPSLPLPDPPAVEETLVRADRLEPEVLPGLKCGGGKQPFSSPLFLAGQEGEEHSPGMTSALPREAAAYSPPERHRRWQAALCQGVTKRMGV